MTEPLKVGLAGLGTVGSAVVNMLASQRQDLEARTGRLIEVTAVSARSRNKARDAALGAQKWFDDPRALAADPGIDVFVELMGGSDDPAKSAVEAALRAGKPVVTANKALLAHHGVALARLSEQHDADLRFEAAVGGAIPIVRTLREASAGAPRRVYGILNGTCNYILTRMEQEGLSFEASLRSAQELGYAEADPSFDIDGHDTAQKLAILASLAFGTEVDADAVHVEGIATIAPDDLRAAEELGYRIKLLGVAMRTEAGVEQRVHPTMVPRQSDIAQVMGVTNAVTIDTHDYDSITLIGPGAGGMATASAVVADIADIARGNRSPAFARPAHALTPSVKAPMQKHEGGYYIRLLALDRPGTAATIAQRLAAEHISLESIVQRRRAGGSVGEPVPVILITYETTEDAVRRALAAVEADGVIAAKPQLIRIEKK